MSFTMEESLECDWVSVRPNVFEEKDKHKFIFIVAWNDIEGKFAVTCHDRTVQKRSAAARDSVSELTEGARLQDKRPVASKSTREKAPDKSKPTRSPSRTAALADIEVLEPEARFPDDTEDPDTGVPIGGDSSWAGLFSFQDLRTAHGQLCAVNSDLEPCLPPFPEQEQQSAVWSVLFGVPEVTRRDTEALCYQLQVYLGHALDTCGWKILSQVLFADGDDTEEYYESLSELRQKGYEDALQRQKKRLHEVRHATCVGGPWGAKAKGGDTRGTCGKCHGGEKRTKIFHIGNVKSGVSTNHSCDVITTSHNVTTFSSSKMFVSVFIQKDANQNNGTELHRFNIRSVG
ncbi:junction-mediating and -regulatory protein isoform X1 [Tachysurus ichikawai]